LWKKFETVPGDTPARAATSVKRTKLTRPIVPRARAVPVWRASNAAGVAAALIRFKIWALR
jgi:hypothetical protein